MRKNLEIKAKYADPEKGAAIAKELGAREEGVDIQEDYYFHTREGLLKLRKSSLYGAYLIPYLRPRKRDKRISDFLTIPIAEPDALVELFGKILGIELIVRKERTIFLYENVRIHLDKVENLGTFIEFEAVFDSQNTEEEEERKKLDYLMERFAVNKNELIGDSYYHLLSESENGD